MNIATTTSYQPAAALRQKADPGGAAPRPFDAREAIRTTVEGIAIAGNLGSAGLLGPASPVLAPLGPGFSGITAGLGVIQLLEASRTHDSRAVVQGLMDIGIGVCGIVGGPVAAGAGAGLMAMRVAHMAWKGSPFS